MRHPKHVFLVILAALAIFAAACGDDDTDTTVSGSGAPATDDDAAEAGTGSETSGEDTDAAFPVTVDSNGTEVTIEAQPESIVSMTPTGTEMLFAVGAGEHVVAADSYSNYPEDAPTTDLSAYEPNLEAIIGYEPDLVVIGDSSDDIVSGLESAGIPSLVLPAATSLDDTYAQIEVVGAATGHVGDAAEVVANMQADIEELVSQIPERDEKPTYYHELDDTLYSVTSQTFIGEIYELAGLENVADAADPDGELGGYPQLSPEFLVDADPDFIFLADTKCCDQTAETVASRGGFENLSAVKEGHVVELDDDIASRWGPRIVDLFRVIVEATATADA